MADIGTEPKSVGIGIFEHETRLGFRFHPGPDMGMKGSLDALAAHGFADLAEERRKSRELVGIELRTHCGFPHARRVLAHATGNEDRIDAQPRMRSGADPGSLDPGLLIAGRWRPCRGKIARAGYDTILGETGDVTGFAISTGELRLDRRESTLRYDGQAFFQRRRN